MDNTDDAQSWAAFRDPTQLLQRLRETGQPLVLMVDGAAAAVVQDAEAYSRLLDLAASADFDEAIRQGCEDVKAGRVRLASETFDDMRVAFGISR